MNTIKSIGQNIKNNRLFLAISLFFIATSAYPSLNMRGLEQSIANFIHESNKTLTAKGYRFEYKIGSIDPRLNFGTCEENLNLEYLRPPTQHEQNTVKVECNGQKHWKLYVSVQIEIFGPVVTAKETIVRNQVITSEHLELSETQINRSGQIGYSETQPLIGMVAKRTIRKGNKISANQVIAPSLVDRGDQIVIIAKNDMIAIKMNGTALSEGALGEQISVKNNQSKRIIKGTVVDKGRVEVNL